MNFQQARLYGILDAGYIAPNQWVEKCNALLKGGVDVLQVRAKKASHVQRCLLLESILHLFDNTIKVPLLMNDDIEAALKYPNIGLHIGQDDIPPLEARSALGPTRLLGWSTHSLEQAQVAIALEDTLDYFAVGPLFSTPTKPDYPPVGIELAQKVKVLQPNLPFFCIGGIKRANLRQICKAGIERIVVVSDIICASDTQKATCEIKKRLMKEKERINHDNCGIA